MTPPDADSLTIKNYRVDQQTYEHAMQRAADEGVLLSTLIRQWVSDYAIGRNRVGPGKPAAEISISRAELTKLRELVDRILQ
jgi:hypothetical protein